MDWKEKYKIRLKFETELKEKFPNLYSGLGFHWRDGGMLGGVEIGEGWYNIIRLLSEKLEYFINKLTEEERPRAVQVKEKFAGLRFYMSAKTKEMSEAIREAEDRSYKVCEYCGAPGYESDYSWWMKTLCEKCHEERKNDQAKMHTTRGETWKLKSKGKRLR